MNYTELNASIQSFCENYEVDFVAAIPTFVKQAEQYIYNSVQLPAIRKNQTASVTSGNQYLTLPADYLASFSLSVITPVTLAQTFLLPKDVNFIRESYPAPGSLGTPKHYAQFDADTYILGPTPDANYGVELHYYYYPESIVTASTSWVGDNFDSVLLYGALVEAAIFMKAEADILGGYKAHFDASLAALKLLGDGKDRRDAYRSGQVRVPVN
jgi:hypothetical protein